MSTVASPPRSTIADRKAAEPSLVTSPQPRSPRRSHIVIWQLALLVALLAAHLGVRVYHTTHQPISMGARHDYIRSYAFSLSLILDKGFNDLPVFGTAAGTPVDDFLWLRRSELSREELRAFAADIPRPSQDPHFGIYAPLASTRVLDIHLTALLWRIFGISWTVLYVVAAVASTVCCLLIYLIGQRLGGGFWPGFLGALIFFASPMEKFLSGWSVRDSSPLWFAAGAFCVLVCFFDRSTSLRRYAVGGLVLGIVAVLGVGWRLDSLIIAPFVAAAMTAAILVRSRRVTSAVAACVCFGMSGLATHALIGQLGPEVHQPAGSGFHMAYYGDAVRSNQLGIENSSQVAWCDMQTAMEARRYAASALGQQEPLLYVTERYGEVCRQMYFGLLRYNAYRWTAAFPAVWWESLRGHPDDSSNYAGWSQFRTTLLDQGRPSGWPTLDFGPVESFFPATIPLLAILGALFAVAFGPQRLLAAALAIFSVYFAAITFAVLPMQKHMAMMLLPTSTFAGVGIWIVIQALRPGWWRDRLGQVTRQGCAAFAVGAVSIIAIWGGTCLVAHKVSANERRQCLDELRTLAARGVDAPETLRGDKVFRVSIPPGDANDRVGYLLTVRTGSEPGPLHCSHRRVASAGLRPTLLTTTHRLMPDQEQHFFVSCLQGSDFGDPRAYTCVVRTTGDARLISSRRVDLANWSGLSVSTVFTQDDSSPGSPIIAEAATSWTPARLPVYATSETSTHPVAGSHEGILFQPPGPVDVRAKPLTHIAAFEPETGLWRILIGDGNEFEPRTLASWSSATQWLDRRAGDFDGDGVSDIAGREAAHGGWWIVSSALGGGRSVPFGGWSAGQTWSHVRPGDFNGDGIDDLVGYADAAGQWWAAFSDGSQFTSAFWANWPNDRPLSHVQAADFDGDGRTDLIGYDATQTIWVTFLSRDIPSQPLESNIPGNSAPRQVCTGDFNGDGKFDLAFVREDSQSICLALSTGTGFDAQSIDFDATNIDTLSSGDFDGDGLDELLLCSMQSGEFQRCRRTDSGWQVENAGSVGQPVRFVAIGQFDGRNGKDVAAFTQSDGSHVGLLNGDRLEFQSWLDPIDPPLGTAPLAVQSFTAR